MSKSLDRERLPESRNSLDEDMSSSEERDDDTTDEVILTDDRSPNLILYVREYLANMCECWIHSMRQIADRVWKYGFFAKKNHFFLIEGVPCIDILSYQYSLD